MKREPIIYFPQSTETLQEKEVVVGEVLRLGKPSKRYYEHVHHALNHNYNQLKEPQELLKLEGLPVKIVSILRMRSGYSIAVLHRKDGKEFLTNIEKLFAIVDKALDTKELKFY